MTTTTELEKRGYFLQQANTYKGTENITGWYASEKLDGYRAFWDGGLSRGQRVGDVPYAAKVIVSSGKPKKWLDKEATGLWSRYANPIWAPNSFLNQLPCCMLDGELWLGRGNFQKVAKCVKKETPGPEWANIQYKVFGSPNPHLVFRSGRVKSADNIDMEIRQEEVLAWVASLKDDPRAILDLDDWEVIDGNFTHEMYFLKEALSTIDGDGPASLHLQTILSDDLEFARQELDQLMERTLSLGGEGMIVRDPEQVWRPKRASYILKVKPCEDDEAMIVGFTSGEETDKGSKLLGLIGAIVLEYQGNQFSLSGFTNEERQFEGAEALGWAITNPGKRVPNGTQGKYFKVGDQITFKYRELSDDGIPKDARYFRKRDEE